MVDFYIREVREGLQGLDLLAWLFTNLFTISLVLFIIHLIQLMTKLIQDTKYLVGGSLRMASGNQDANIEKQETSAMGKFQAVEFTLTQDQYTIIQHFLPKGYTLQERKSTKREKGSSQKLIDAEMSRFSGGFENTEENQGRSKRARIKKIDRYLEDEMPRVVKRTSTQRLSLDDQMSQCAKILAQLKKNPNCFPFLDPVDPKKSGASHYFDVIKDPMDFATIERNLKAGQYHSATQFNADISKIWYNSYAYNEKSSKIYKMTVEMEKYYKKLLTEPAPKRQSLPKSKPKSIDKPKINEEVERPRVEEMEMEDEMQERVESEANHEYDV